jgi:hypothetical protein
MKPQRIVDWQLERHRSPAVGGGSGRIQVGNEYRTHKNSTTKAPNCQKKHFISLSIYFSMVGNFTDTAKSWAGHE